MSDATFLKVHGIARLGGMPEMRYSPSGNAATNFSAAINREWTGNDGQRQKETIWVRFSCWGKLAEIVNQYLKTGSLIYFEGRLNADPQSGGPRVYTRQDGSTGASFEITADTVRFLSARGEDSTVSQDAPQMADNEIPF